MKAKEQVTFYDAIKGMEIESLEKIKELLLSKKMTNDNFDKLNLVEVEIEKNRKLERYMKKL